MQNAGRPGKLMWAALLALHTIVFVVGYMIAVRVVWGVAAILMRSGAQINLVVFLNSHGLLTASAAGFVVGLIGVAGIEAAFGLIRTRQSLVDQPSLFVCLVFAAWFAVGVLRWVVKVVPQQSVLVESSPQWFTSFANTFFLADCPSDWLIHWRSFDFDSCSNQLMYTTLFVGSAGYVASRLVAGALPRTHQTGDTALTADDYSAEE